MTVSIFSQIKITFQACFPSRRLFPVVTQCRPLWQREALAFLGSGDELGFYLQDESKRDEPNSNSWFREGARLATLGGEGPNSAEVGCLRMVFVFPKMF